MKEKVRTPAANRELLKEAGYDRAIEDPEVLSDLVKEWHEYDPGMEIDLFRSDTLMWVWLRSPDKGKCREVPVLLTYSCALNGWSMFVDVGGWMKNFRTRDELLEEFQAWKEADGIHLCELDYWGKAQKSE